MTVAKVVRAEQGQRLMMGPGAPFILELVGDQTGGAFTLVDMTVPPGDGPPPHIHDGFAETFRVVKGRLLIEADGEPTEAGPGDVVHVPPGVAHLFRTIGSEPAEVVVLVTPGGHEDYFIELTDAIAQGGEGPEYFGRLAAVMARHGVRFAGQGGGPPGPR